MEPENDHAGPRDLSSPVERTIARSLDDEGGAGKPLTRRARQTRRTIESYLAAGFMPRYIERLRDIEREVAALGRDLERSRRALWRECRGDSAEFGRRWVERAHRWRFDRINALIREHNEWYPIERNLPLNPRTGDYVRIRGRSYRRTPVSAEWVLERFPPSPPPESAGRERRAS